MIISVALLLHQHLQSLQLSLTLCNPMNCSLPGSSLHGIFQARIVEWVCHALLQVIFLTHRSSPCQELFTQTISERLPIPVFWPGEFHGLYSSWAGKESDMTEQLSLYCDLYGVFITDETEFRNFIVWLEDQKIRYQQIRLKTERLYETFTAVTR